MKYFTITLYIFFSCFIIATKSYGITRLSCTSGNWATASTWNPAGAPACGDSVVIQSGHIVSLSNQQNYNSCSAPLKIIIYGTMKFSNGSKLSLACGSYIIVYPGGSIDADVGLSNSNLIEICGNIEWNSNTKPLTGPACLPPTHAICTGVLPVELSRFNGTNCNSIICLSWETVSERNNDHFEVQRSADGTSFTGILQTDSKAPGGTSSNKIKYEANDVSPLSGINYYRLKQTDKDGSYSYSQMIALQSNLPKEMEFVVFPNTNSGEFTAQVKGLRDPGNVTILLRDASGIIMYKTRQYIDNTGGEIKVNPEWKLPNGVYSCSFLIGDAEYVVKVVITNS